jgi:predicted nucleic acid-binding protein
MTSSELAIVELARVEKATQPSGTARATAHGLLAEVDLVSVTRGLLEQAAELTSSRVRSLDAIHLATALAIVPDELVAYDRRLLDAAAEAGLTVASPGA